MLFVRRDYGFACPLARQHVFTYGECLRSSEDRNYYYVFITTLLVLFVCFFLLKDNNNNTNKHAYNDTIPHETPASTMLFPVSNRMHAGLAMICNNNPQDSAAVSHCLIPHPPTHMHTMLVHETTTEKHGHLETLRFLAGKAQTGGEEGGVGTCIGERVTSLMLHLAAEFGRELSLLLREERAGARGVGGDRVAGRMSKRTNIITSVDSD